jgi:hypothetical protein
VSTVVIITVCYYRAFGDDFISEVIPDISVHRYLLSKTIVIFIWLLSGIVIATICTLIIEMPIAFIQNREVLDWFVFDILHMMFLNDVTTILLVVFNFILSVSICIMACQTAISIGVNRASNRLGKTILAIIHINGLLLLATSLLGMFELLLSKTLATFTGMVVFIDSSFIVSGYNPSVWLFYSLNCLSFLACTALLFYISRKNITKKLRSLRE